MVCLLILKQLEKFIPWQKCNLCYDESKKIYIRCNLINVTLILLQITLFYLQNSRAHLPLTFLTLANGWCTDSQNDQFVLSLIGMVMTFLHFGKHYNYLCSSHVKLKGIPKIWHLKIQNREIITDAFAMIYQVLLRESSSLSTLYFLN